MTLKVIRFYAENENVLTQLVDHVPPVGEAIKIKGRKGKVIQVNEINDRMVNVLIEFDKIRRRNTAPIHNKRRR